MSEMNKQSLCGVCTVPELKTLISFFTGRIMMEKFRTPKTMRKTGGGCREKYIRYPSERWNARPATHKHIISLVVICAEPRRND